MIRVGGQSGTAIRSTMSSARADGASAHRIVRPSAAPAKTLKLARFISPIRILHTVIAVRVFYALRRVDLLTDDDSGLPQEEMRISRRDLDIDSAAWFV